MFHGFSDMHSDGLMNGWLTAF